MLRTVIRSAIAIAIVHSAALAESFPYTAYVTLDSASVRSGPGDSFYPTSRVGWAEPVEVYRHDSDRWAAIRPPLNSFSWVPGDAIKVTASEPTIGRVTKSGFKTRIGSTINSDHRGVEYVTLKVGESVNIQDQENRAGKMWYRISPPAGEFRWIRISDLSKQDPTIEKTEASAADTLTIKPPDTTASPVSTSIFEPEPLELAQFLESTPTDGQRNSEPAAVGPLGQSITPGETTFGALPAYDASSMAPRDRIDGGFSQIMPILGVGIPPTPAGMIKPGPVARKLLLNELADIELQLSLTVSQPAVAWEMSPLRIRTQALIDTSDDPEVRGRATGLLSKIAQFSDIRRRQNSVDAEAAQIAQSIGGPSVLATTYGGMYGGGQYYAGQSSGYSSDSVAMSDGGYSVSPGMAASTAYNYDGTGWLMPVVTDRDDMPKYVLTDNKGDIIQFVSPSPGMNLKEYESKQVGIIGAKNRLKDTNQPHIVADRVINLEKVRR